MHKELSPEIWPIYNKYLGKSATETLITRNLLYTKTNFYLQALKYSKTILHEWPLSPENSCCKTPLVVTNTGDKL